jgi:ATP-dependent Clp protease ATP-binding subunit ClpX
LTNSGDTGLNEYQCSFCGKPRAQADQLIAGEGKVFICDECVDVCYQIVNQRSKSHPDKEIPLRPPMVPLEMHGLLDQYVIGQDRAKRALSVAVYNHYKRFVGSGSEGYVEVQKSNVLLIGPTGSGKTLLAQTLARILEVPFCICDATSLTEAGYVGEDVENILLRLIQVADYDLDLAARGIIYIDEIDKIGRKNPNPSVTRDVSGEGVQQALLKIIEGTVANIPPQGGRKHPHQEVIQLNTDGILFVCGGSFEGLEDVIQKRLSWAKSSIGFRNRATDDAGHNTSEIMNNVSTEDLLEYGFIPEFIGRLPVMVILESLDQSKLIQVLTNPKNALIKQYKYLFSLDGVDLDITSDALSAVADEAIKRKTGARALRNIVEEALMDVMYQIPSVEGVKRCLVERDVIIGNKQPLLLTESGKNLLESDLDNQQIA